MAQSSRDFPLDELVEQAEALSEKGENKKAVSLLRRAANAGNLSAQLNLGVHLSSGRGVRRSVGEAMYWFKRAASRGYAAAASNVAALYTTQGRVRLALRWYLKASALGDDDAKVEAARLFIKRLDDEMSAKPLLSMALKSKCLTEKAREDAAKLLRDLQR